MNYFLQKLEKKLEVGPLKFNFDLHYPSLISLFVNDLNSKKAEFLRASPFLKSCKRVGNFFNFDLSDDCLKEVLWPLAWKGFPLVRGRNLIETSSFNPTGLPHAGNLHLYFHGSVFHNLLSIAGGRVVNIYYINDLGDQFNLLTASSSRDPEQILGEKMGEILDKLSPWGFAMPSLFFRESAFSTRAKKIVGSLKTSKEEDGCFFAGEKGRYYLQKRKGGETTYLANDLAFHSYLQDKGFHQSFITLGTDHKGHVIKMKELSREIIKGASLEFFCVGKISIKQEGEIIKLSKRKGVTGTPSNIMKDWKLISLSRRTKEDHLIDSGHFSAIKIEWREIFVAHFRLKGMVGVLSVARLQGSGETVKLLAQLEQQISISLLKGDINPLYRLLVRVSKITNSSFPSKYDYLNLRRIIIILNKILRYV